MDALVLRTVNASLPHAVNAEQLASDLRGGGAADCLLPHVVAFFTELTISAIEGFAWRHNIALAELRKAYEAMKLQSGECSSDVEEWFNYMENTPQGSDQVLG